jgi:hypothetical protein
MTYKKASSILKKAQAHGFDKNILARAFFIVVHFFLKKKH